MINPIPVQDKLRRASIQACVSIMPVLGSSLAQFTASRTTRFEPLGQVALYATPNYYLDLDSLSPLLTAVTLVLPLPMEFPR